MPIEVWVDEYDGIDYERTDEDTGLTVGNAIERAAKDNAVSLPPRNQADDVKLNGVPATYRTPIPGDQEDVIIEVNTEVYKNRRANAAENAPHPLRKKMRKKA